MNLLIDIGNTSLRWALFPSGQDGNGLGPMSAVRHGRAVPPDLLAAWESLEPPERVLIGNVGGAAVGEAVARVIRAYWGASQSSPRPARTAWDYGSPTRSPNAWA